MDLIDTDLILKSAENLLVMFLGNPSFDQIPQIPQHGHEWQLFVIYNKEIHKRHSNTSHLSVNVHADFGGTLEDHRSMETLTSNDHLKCLSFSLVS